MVSATSGVGPDGMPMKIHSSLVSEDELFKVCEKAWENLPLHKILIAFEMRKDCARECIATGGDIDREGKDHGKAGKRVHVAPEYAALRKKLNLDEN